MWRAPPEMGKTSSGWLTCEEADTAECHPGGLLEAGWIIEMGQAAGGRRKGGWVEGGRLCAQGTDLGGPLLRKWAKQQPPPQQHHHITTRPPILYPVASFCPRFSALISF